MRIRLLVVFLSLFFVPCELISQINDSLRFRVNTSVKFVKPIKKCNVILQVGKAYDLNPHDIDSRSTVTNIPAYRDAKIVANGNDYDVFFPNIGYNGHELTFYETSGSIFNYYFPYGKFPFDTLRAHGIFLVKSDTSHAACYIEVKTSTGSFRDGIKQQSNHFELSNMTSHDVPIGSYYDVSIYSFRDSGRFLDQQFKVYLKTCAATNVRRCE